MSDTTPDDLATDRALFERLYKRSHERLVAHLTGMVRDRNRAEDAAASAFQRAWEKRANFRAESTLGTWLHAIGRNEALLNWRRERAALFNSLDRVETARHGEPDRVSDSLEREDLRFQVRRALDRVPATYRWALLTRYVDGRSIQEMARAERVPVGTIARRLFTARRLLRAAWESTLVRGAERHMDDKAQLIAEQALKQLADELKAGRSDALKDYLAAMGRFPRYSWNNAVLIHSQRPTATRIAGYHTWHQLGRFVKRGEKGIAILAPIRVRALEPTESHETGEANRAARIVGFRTAYVFDVDQTEGRPLPQFATTSGDPREYMDRLKAFVAGREIAIEYDASIAPAQGQSSGGLIQLRPGMAPAEEFSVLAHELAHEMLHHSHRDVGLPKQVVETQAEAVAFVVCRGVGLETGTAAGDYIALYNGDAKTLAKSLAVIQEASSQILKELLPDERTPPAAEHAFDGYAYRSTAPQPSAGRSSSLDRPAAPPAPDSGDSITWDR